MRPLPLAALALAHALAAPPVSADVLQVPGDHPTIQGALDAALDGDEIEVAAGTWVGTLDLRGKAVTLRGAAPVPAVILDGGGSGPILLVASGEGPDTVLEDLVVTGGFAPQGAGMRIEGASPTVRRCVFRFNEGQRGAGVDCVDGSPAFEECVFEANISSATAAGFSHTGTGAARLSDCSFLRNRAIFSAGASIVGDDLFERCVFDGNWSFISDAGLSLGPGDPILRDCRFLRGFAPDGGGGLGTGGGSPRIERCLFQRNISTDRGGAVHNFGTGDAVFVECVFEDNRSTGSGGAIYSINTSFTFRDCTFTDNLAPLGGAVRNRGGDPRFEGCTFIDNHASSGGAVADLQGTAATYADCSFASNDADGGVGGAMFLQSASPRIERCTFTRNASSTGASALHLEGPTVLEVVDSTFWGHEGAAPTVDVTQGAFARLRNVTMHDNTAGASAAVCADATSAVDVVGSILWGNDPAELGGAGAITASHSDVQGGFPGTGNLDLDPGFVDGAAGDLRLAPGSPCIDAGGTSGWGEALVVSPASLSAGTGGAAAFTLSSGRARADLSGGERFHQDPPLPGGVPAVDMGAHEAGSPAAMPQGSVLLGSFAGTSPGLRLGSLTLPLNPDAYFTLTLESPSEPPLEDFQGTLDGAGRARASLEIPPGTAGLVGLTAHHAFLVLPPGGGFPDAVSPAVALNFTP